MKSSDEKPMRYRLSSSGQCSIPSLAAREEVEQRIKGLEG
jgi:hypothetical protein